MEIIHGIINIGDSGIYLLSIYENNNAIDNAIETPNVNIKLPMVYKSKNLVTEFPPSQIQGN